MAKESVSDWIDVPELEGVRKRLRTTTWKDPKGEGNVYSCLVEYEGGFFADPDADVSGILNFDMLNKKENIMTNSIIANPEEKSIDLQENSLVILKDMGFNREVEVKEKETLIYYTVEFGEEMKLTVTQGYEIESNMPTERTVELSIAEHYELLKHIQSPIQIIELLTMLGYNFKK